jgi:hypothetical protein
MRLHGPRKRFLARPFWRDYVVAYVLIGVGFTMVDVGASQRESSDRLFVLIPAFTLLAFGSVVFFCAVGWSLWSTWRTRRAAEPKNY